MKSDMESYLRLDLNGLIFKRFFDCNLLFFTYYVSLNFKCITVTLTFIRITFVLLRENDASLYVSGFIFIYHKLFNKVMDQS